jgi:toxin ParE1/3/4
MVMKVFWSDTALSQLEDIYNYHKIVASESVAKKLVKTLVEQTIFLELNPLLGKKEPLLAVRKYEYRFLVKGQYKIIYHIDNNYIKITSVFDCRQNPDKITEPPI